MSTSLNDRRKQGTPKPSGRRYLWITAVVLLVGIGIYAGVGNRPGVDKPPEESVTSAKAALEKAYAEANADLKKKRLSAAAIKLRQIANIDPRFRDAGSRAKTIAAELLKQAEKDIASGDYKAAKDKLDAAKEADPANKKIAKKHREATDKIAPAGGGAAPESDTSTPPAGDTARAIPADATPESLLIGEIPGYLTVQSGWLKKPVEAGSTYKPTSVEVGKEIDRVLFTIAKLETKQDAEDRLKLTQEAWGIEPQEITINGHGAFTGIYNFEDSAVFKLRAMATIAWTRENWFFMISVVPKGTPDSDYKKGVARDVAIKLGY